MREIHRAARPFVFTTRHARKPHGRSVSKGVLFFSCRDGSRVLAIRNGLDHLFHGVQHDEFFQFGMTKFDSRNADHAPVVVPVPGLLISPILRLQFS
jgi:hypothetical protein